MPDPAVQGTRASWAVCAAGIIALGILSRVAHTGFVLLDKYLGDVLYAAMVYAILRLFRKSAAAAMYAGVLMTAIELFQLTMIPDRLMASEQLPIRIFARLLGTTFSFLDLLAYAVGIACIYLMDSSRSTIRSGGR